MADMPKKQWRKPEVRVLEAGAAENATQTKKSDAGKSKNLS